MMAYSSRFLAGVVVLALIVFSSAAPAKAISCSLALQYMMPCQSFLTGNAKITSACCLSAQQLVRATASQADRKSVCHCLKQIALSTNVNQKKAEQLPHLCKIDVPATVQPNIDCDAILGVPAGDVRVELKRYKNVQMGALHGTSPGHSPGIGSGRPPPVQMGALHGTSPGHSPGIGSGHPPPAN